jgi:hypothetical protein
MATAVAGTTISMVVVGFLTYGVVAAGKLVLKILFAALHSP